MNDHGCRPPDVFETAVMLRPSQFSDEVQALLERCADVIATLCRRGSN